MRSPSEKCRHTGPPRLCSHPVTCPPSQSGTGTSLLSHLDSKSKAGREKNKREEEGGRGRGKNPGPHPPSVSVMVKGEGRWDHEPGQGLHGDGQGQIPGLLFPSGWLFWESSFAPAVDRLATADAGIRKTQSSASTGTGEGRENSPTEQKASSGRPGNSTLSAHRPTHASWLQPFSKDLWAPGVGAVWFVRGGPDLMC